MTNDLRERLDDLLGEVPAHVHADAAAAWRTGDRRRLRSRGMVVGGVVGVVALIAGSLTWGSRIVQTQPAGGVGTSRGAVSYPVRVERPLLRTGGLPDRPGAIAGVVGRPDGWYAVGQRGQLWSLPGATDTDYPPAVSPDGTWLAYLDARLPSVVSVDLRTGERTDDDIGLTIPPNNSVLRPHGQMFWSPDASKLLVPVLPGVGQGEAVARVVGRASQSRPIPAFITGRVIPAGWYDAHTLVWVRWTKDPQGKSTIASATAILTNLRGRIEATIPLHLRHQWIEPLTSASVSVSPGGRLLALGADRGADGLSVFTFRLAGPLRGRMRADLEVQNAGAGVGCPASWDRFHIQLPGAGPPDTIVRMVTGGSTIYADPRLHISCSVWATSALSGTAYRDFTTRVFDDTGTLQMGTTSWLSWHWREVLAVGAAALVALGAALVWRRRRRTRRLTAVGPPG